MENRAALSQGCIKPLASFSGEELQRTSPGHALVLPLHRRASTSVNPLLRGGATIGT